ncbi:MAG: hypothetical protein HYU99_11785 [Deltaproteobacteria bacterium]|nr:hypothetical protein [Deltaproteobacteria bacterium]
MLDKIYILVSEEDRKIYETCDDGNPQKGAFRSKGTEGAETLCSVELNDEAILEFRDKYLSAVKPRKLLSDPDNADTLTLYNLFKNPGRFHFIVPANAYAKSILGTWFPTAKSKPNAYPAEGLARFDLTDRNITLGQMADHANFIVEYFPSDREAFDVTKIAQNYGVDFLNFTLYAYDKVKEAGLLRTPLVSTGTGGGMGPTVGSSVVTGGSPASTSPARTTPPAGPPRGAPSAKPPAGTKKPEPKKPAPKPDGGRCPGGTPPECCDKDPNNDTSDC